MYTQNFQDYLTLKFKDISIEQLYSNHKQSKRKKLNIIMLSILLAYSIVTSLLYIFNSFSTQVFKGIYYFNSLTTYTISGIYFFLLLLSISSKIFTIQYWVSITGFSLLLFLDGCFRAHLYFGSDFYIFCTIFCIQ